MVQVAPGVGMAATWTAAGQEAFPGPGIVPARSNNAVALAALSRHTSPSADAEADAATTWQVPSSTVTAIGDDGHSAEIAHS